MNEQQDDHLPEHRELRPCIPHDKARHAGRARCGKHRIHHAQPTAAARRGQRQQQRAQRDQQHKAHADDLGRVGAHQQAFVMRFLFSSFSHEELLLPPRQPWRFRGGIVLARCAAGVLFIGYTFFLFPST